MSHGRRRFMTGVAGLASVGLAGCAERSATEPSPIERWVPPADRNQLVGSALGSSTASYLSYEDLLEQAESLSPPVRKPLGEERRVRAGRYDLPPARLGGLVSVGTVSVYPGLAASETEAVGRALEGGDYRTDGEHAGYRFYRTGTDLVAVGDGTVLSGPRSEFVRRSMEATIDAASGEGERRVDVDDDFGLAAAVSRDVDTAQVDTFFAADETDPESGSIAGGVAMGVGYTVRAEETEAELRYVFGRREAVDVDAFERVVLRQPALAPYDLGEPTADGRVVSVSGTVPTWEFDFLEPGSPNGLAPRRQ